MILVDLCWTVGFINLIVLEIDFYVYFGKRVENPFSFVAEQKHRRFYGCFRFSVQSCLMLLNDTSNFHDDNFYFTVPQHVTLRLVSTGYIFKKEFADDRLGKVSVFTEKNNIDFVMLTRKQV